MLLLTALAILQFLRVLEKKTWSRFVVLGMLMGLAYLAKEPAILLGPAYWIYLLITPTDRSLLRNPYWYLAHAVFLAVIAPDLLWNASQGSDSYLNRDLALASQALRISVKPLSLYLGEGFRMVLGRDVLGDDYAEGNIYTCHLVAGAIYLVAIIGALGSFRRPAVRCLVIVFLLVFIFFLVLPGGGFYEPFWWASISLIPAVVCAAGWIAHMAGIAPRRAATVLAVSAVVLAGLGLATAYAMMNEGIFEPRATVRDFADDFLMKGQAALQRDDLHEAEGRFIYVLNIGGPRADAYLGLAQIAEQRQQPEKALRLLAKCLALDPQHAGAVELKRKLERK